MQLIVKILLKELLNNWEEWDRYKSYYISELFPALIKDPSKGTIKEKELLLKIKEIATKNEWDNLGKFLEEIIHGNYSVNNIIGKIRLLASNGDFDKADELFKQIRYLHVNILLPHEYENIKNDFCQKTIYEINQLLKQYKFDKAENLYIKYSKIIKGYNFKNYKNKYLNKKQGEEILNKLCGLIKDGKFLEADNIFKDSENLLVREEYENIKSEYIQNDLNSLTKNIGDKFDREKAKALATTGQYILVQARAGSGKTTVVALKVRQLIKYYGLKPEEIMVLAFNKKAAEEFQNRINKYCQDIIVDKTNSSTFHSLAYRLVNPGEQLLFNDNQKDNEFVRGQQSEFIGKIYNQILDDDRGIILTLLYNFFRSLAMEKLPADFNNKNDFYLYIRNLHYVTLGGERVKSKGEKFIADFLFEHKIFINRQEVEYKYEWNLPGGRRRYKPDFSFWSLGQSKNKLPHAILEHFGITQKHPAGREYMSEKEEQDYIEGVKWKKKYCRENNICFLSTSVDDFDETTKEDERAHFEQILKNCLNINGFDLKKLSQAKIIVKMLEARANLDQFFDQMTQFINRSKKQLLTPADIQKLAESKINKLNGRIIYFIKIVRRVYERYQTQLKKENKIDFDDLLVKAIETIKQTNGECELEIFGKMRSIKNIKYILVDEYQDFSRLFYQLIDAIKFTNPGVSIFCVGDDWQAINGFAGSDLEYFSNFENYFDSSYRTSLLTNHRSLADIVNHSNHVMSGFGDGGFPKKNEPKGEIYLCPVPYVEWRIQQECREEYVKDEIYRSRAKLLGSWQNKEMEVSRYLKIIEKIIKKNINKEICFLFRTNNFYGIKIEKFKNKIKEWYPRGKKIICSTSHSYKGKESDVIIIVDANRKNYPKIHPDNELMEILGVTLSKVIEEERHLFYVAITRAKEQLYMLYEEELGCSDFIPSEWAYSSLNLK